jgi:anti-sigma factor RsiW
MKCNEVIELSPLYLAGNLDPGRAAEFKAHLAACQDCARDLSLDARLRRAVLAEPLDGTAADLKIRRSIARQLRLRRMSIAVGIAAMLVAAVLVFPRVYRIATQGSAVYAAAAEDHRREVVEHARRNWVSQPDQVDALAARQGIASARAEIDGYRLEHAKLCRLNGRIFLHAVYSDGARGFSLFLRQPDGGHTSPVRVTVTGRECVAGFETSRAAAIVVADRASDAARFAQAAAAAL